MKETVYKFEIGERVMMLNGSEGVIVALGININKLPLYKIGERWYMEHQIEKWYPPCPV